MFERYTEQARRVLFFGRYEASQLGSVSIETEHLLLGLIRESKGLASRIFARSNLPIEKIRAEIQRRVVIRAMVSTSVEIPFSAPTKRALQFAAEEADRLLHHHIGTEHLLLGLLREEQSIAAAVLNEAGLRLESVRDAIVQLQGRDGRIEEPPRAFDDSIPARQTTPAPDFVPSSDVHFMYSRLTGTSRVGGPRELSLCGFTVKAAIASLWDTDEGRIEMPPALTTYQRYDIVVKLPRDETREAIHALVRQALEKQFGVEVATESRSTDVYVLTAQPVPGSALRTEAAPSGAGAGVVHFTTARPSGLHQPSLFPMDSFSLAGMPSQGLVQTIERIVGRPVVDEAGLTGVLDLHLHGTLPDRDAFIRALRDQAGLTLTADRRDIPVVVVRQR